MAFDSSSLTSGGLGGSGGFLGDVGSVLGTTQFKADPNVANIPNYAAWLAMLQSQMAGAQRQITPQSSGGAADPFRAAQSGLAGALTAQANGTGPSLAQGMFQRNADSNIANVYSMAASNPNDPGAMRNAANLRASLTQQGAVDASQLRMQEQMQAQNQLGQVLAGARGQDIGQTSDANKAIQYYLGAGMSLAEAQQQAAMDLLRLNQNSYYRTADAGQKLVGGIAQGVGSVAGLGSTGAGGAAGAGSLAGLAI